MTEGTAYLDTTLLDQLMDFSIRSQGLSNVINSSNDVLIDWQLKAFRTSKSITYENKVNIFLKKSNSIRTRF